MVADDRKIQELLESKTDLPLDNIKTVFHASDSTGAFTVDITIQSLPFAMTLDELLEAAIGGIRDVLRTWKANSQLRMVVGGRAAIILDSEYDISEVVQSQTGTTRNIQLYTVENKVGWFVNCAFATEAFQQISETCDAILRTFRILR